MKKGEKLYSEEVVEQYLPPVVNKSTNRITTKQKLFSKEYVANNGNGTQAALKIYDTNDPTVANAIATENLRKPLVRQEIVSLLEKSDFKMEEVFAIHKRNMLQDKHLPTSQKAVSDYYEITGFKNQDKPTNDVKIAFVIEKEN